MRYRISRVYPGKGLTTVTKLNKYVYPDVELNQNKYKVFIPDEGFNTRRPNRGNTFPSFFPRAVLTSKKLSKSSKSEIHNGVKGKSKDLVKIIK